MKYYKGKKIERIFVVRRHCSTNGMKTQIRVCAHGIMRTKIV